MRAVMPGSRRIHCYLTDEEARRQAEAIALCEEVAEQFSVRALAASVATFIGAVLAAVGMAFS